MQLIEMCEKFNIPLIYASSASVYGCNPKNFNENSKLDPSNYYSISKSLIDLFVKKKILKNNKLKIIGLRYFNVYGPGEEKKKEMASVFFHFNKQMKKKLLIKLFKGTGGYNNGEQKRDFIHVNDCVNINLFFYKKFKSGIYNVVTGVANTFNEIAKSIFNFYKKKIMIKYIDMPKDLSDSYQNFTKANISKLRNAGYVKNFISNFSEGKNIKLPISSFSLDPSIATDFADNVNNGNTLLGEDNNQSVIIKVVNKNNSFNGFSMNSNVDKFDPYEINGEWDISEYEYQQEVLMPSNNNYKVVKMETKNMEDDRTLTIITLEQIEASNEIKLREFIDDTETDILKKHLQYPNRISLLYKQKEN